MHELSRESSTLIRWVDEIAHLEPPSGGVRIDIQPSPSNHTLLRAEHDSPGSKTIYAPTLSMSTKPPLTCRPRLCPKGKPHVFPVALNLVEGIDVRISEFSKKQVRSLQFRHKPGL